MTELYNVGNPINREERNNLNATFRNIRDQMSKININTSLIKGELQGDVQGLQTQINTLVVDGDSSPEAAQARVGYNNQTYTTLKSRLDNEFEDAKKSIYEVSLNIKDFGAQGEGSPDDTALLEALEFISVNSSVKEIFFPKTDSYYLFEDEYLIPEGVSFRSNGASVQFKRKVTFENNNKIEGFIFDGRDSCGGFVINGSLTDITKNTFLNQKPFSTGEFFSIDVNLATNVTITDNHFNGLKPYNNEGSGGDIVARFIRVYRSNDVLISRNHFSGGDGLADSDYVHIITSLVSDNVNFPWRNADIEGYFIETNTTVDSNTFRHDKIKSCIKVQGSNVKIKNNEIQIGTLLNSDVFSRAIRIYNCFDIYLDNNKVTSLNSKMNCMLECFPVRNLNINNCTFSLKGGSQLNPFFFNFKNILGLTMKGNEIELPTKGTSILLDGVKNALLDNNKMNFSELSESNFNMFYVKTTAQGETSENIDFTYNNVDGNKTVISKVFNSGIIKNINFYNNVFKVKQLIDLTYIDGMNYTGNKTLVNNTLMTLNSSSGVFAKINISNNEIDNSLLDVSQQFLFVRSFVAIDGLNVINNTTVKAVEANMIDIMYNTSGAQNNNLVFYQPGSLTIRDIGFTTGRNPYRKLAGMQYYDTSLNKKITWTGAAWVDNSGSPV